MKMATNCSPTALINGLFSVSLSAVQSNPNRLFSVSFPDKKWKKSNNPLRFSCIAAATKPAMVTGKAWDKLILHSETPVLVEFYASWCGPCRMVHRVIEEISNDYAGSLNCFVLDADKDITVAENYDIKAVPVVLLFKNGVKYDSIIGTMPKEFYAAAVERVLAS